ncbi:MAG TPA: fumarylacetoacetate hydrolase family protein [Pantanalinema sp.]
MKLVTFEVATPLGRIMRLGAAIGDRILDLNAAYVTALPELSREAAGRFADVYFPPDMLRFLEGGTLGMEAARALLSRFVAGTLAERPDAGAISYPVGEVRLLSPLTRANMLRDFLAFEAHTKRGYERRGQEMPALWYELPVYYKGNNRSLVGPDAEVPWPSYTEKFDYELEIACVIGKQGRNIPLERAHEYIAGYCILNDFSARDAQMQEVQLRLGPAKGKDFATGLGPYLVTPDEVGDPRNLRMTARVNGEIWSDGNSGTSHWTFEQMIAHVSREETIYPGDVFGSGTVGSGCGYELDRWVQPGDVIELTIEKLGTLRNRVVRQS